MQTREDVADFISQRPHIVALLEAVEALELPDSWIGAGLIRGSVWDKLHGYPDVIAVNDVDVVYFDPADVSPGRDAALEAALRSRVPDMPWEVRNQARMHNRNRDAPYTNTADALRCWVTTATAIAARAKDGRIELLAPHGVEDLLGLIVRPTPHFRSKLDIYRQNVATKGWARRWPKLTFFDI
jgi:uncharacterized protein